MNEHRQNSTPGRTPCGELSCEELVAFLDGELEEPAAERVREHLLRCMPCEREAGLLRASGDLVSALPRPTVTAGFADRVLAAAVPARPRGRLLRIAPIAAAAAAGILVTLLAGRALFGTDPTPVSPSAEVLNTEEEAEIARDLHVLLNLEALLEGNDPEELIALVDDLALLESVEAEELGLYEPEDDGG